MVVFDDQDLHKSFIHNLIKNVVRESTKIYSANVFTSDRIGFRTLGYYLSTAVEFVIELRRNLCARFAKIVVHRGFNIRIDLAD